MTGLGGGFYTMVAANDGSLELIGHRETVRVTDGDRLVRVLGRYDMQPWADGDLTTRWVYGDADGAPPDPCMGSRTSQHVTALVMARHRRGRTGLSAE